MLIVEFLGYLTIDHVSFGRPGISFLNALLIVCPKLHNKNIFFPAKNDLPGTKVSPYVVRPASSLLASYLKSKQRFKAFPIDLGG